MRITLMSVIGLCILVVGPFIFHFWKVGISGDPKDWAQFSGYVGGVISPALSFAGLVMVVRTFELAETRRSEDLFVGALKELSSARAAAITAYDEAKKVTSPTTFEQILRFSLDLPPDSATWLFGYRGALLNLEVLLNRLPEKSKQFLRPMLRSKFDAGESALLRACIPMKSAIPNLLELFGSDTDAKN